jgi:hypothetical protein
VSLATVERELARRALAVTRRDASEEAES